MVPTTLPAPAHTPLRRRLVAALAVAVAAVLAAATAPVASHADPPPGDVGFFQIDAGELSHQPILIFRYQFSNGSPPGVSFERDVASIEIPGNKVPGLVAGQTLIVVTSSVSRLNPPRVTDLNKTADTALIDLLLRDTAGHFRLVGMDLLPLKDEVGNVVNWADIPILSGATPSLRWPLKNDPSADVRAAYQGNAAHAERILALFAKEFDRLAGTIGTVDPEAAAQTDPGKIVKRGDLSGKVTDVTSELPYCQNNPSNCYDEVKSREFYANAENAKWITDAPPTDEKLKLAQKKAKEEGKPIPTQKSDQILAGIQKLWVGKKMPTGPGVDKQLRAQPANAPADLFNRPGNSPAPSVLSDALNSAKAGPGGIDFSTLELRYLADPGPSAGQGVRYAFNADSASSGLNVAAGRTAAVEASDSFFVWLELPPDKFWVNLNPEEPDRIVDPQFGTTDAGRILLQADLQMKKTVAKLIHPDSTLGKAFWRSLSDGTDQKTCLSFRQWISPAPATVREDGDGIYIVDAPLTVQLESEFLETTGAAGESGSCSPYNQAAQEAAYRSLILPKVQDAVNRAPEYAELRRVYLSRVAAEWYRQRSAKQSTWYGDMIDQGDVSSWPARQDWSPKTVFDQYVNSYTKGEFHVRHQRRDGEYLVTDTYVFGGVDFSKISFTELDEAGFQSRAPDLSTLVETAMTRPAADHQNKVWIGAVAAAPTPKASTTAKPKTRTGNGWLWPTVAAYAVLLVLLFLFRRRLSQRTSSERMAQIDRSVLTLAVVLGVAAASLITRKDGGSEPPQSVAAAKIPNPVVVYRPKVEPHTAASSYSPAPAQALPQAGFTAGTCLTGKIPDITVAVPANDVIEVPCGSKSAHYKVIKTFRGTSNMSRCDSVRRTQYAYSETLTINGAPVNEFVYCLIGLGPYAR